MDFYSGLYLVKTIIGSKHYRRRQHAKFERMVELDDIMTSKMNLKNFINILGVLEPFSIHDAVKIVFFSKGSTISPWVPSLDVSINISFMRYFSLEFLHGDLDEFN